MRKRSRSWLRRLALESLETRTLLSTLPTSVVSTQAPVSQGSSTQDDSSPYIAIDPINPMKLVTVYTDRNTAGGVTTISAQAASSSDGGQTWTSLTLPGNQFDRSVTTGAAYSISKGEGVGFDRSENFYIGVLEANSGNNSGLVDVDKFDFTGSSPTGPNENIAYLWNQAASGQNLQSAIANFSLAVDSNTPIFVDPTTGATQRDPSSGNVYIAWTTITPPPSPAPNPFNPNVIQLVASADGVNFATYNPSTDVGDETQATELDFGHAGPQRFTAPRIAVSQDGGNVTVIWDDFGTFATATPPADAIFANTSTVNGTTITPGAITLVTETTVRGALAAPYPLSTPSSPTGIGPGAEIAVDNTLGSFSAHQGRIYVTYVDRYTFDVKNPTDNTDIFLVFSDDGGQTWSSPQQVNDDSGAIDGHSGAVNINTDLGVTARHPDGRPQYQPSIAVDSSTGTVAMSWLDVRDDPTKTRYATYLTTSIDGGQTFSKDVFANIPNTVTDAITGKPVVIGPLSDNAATYNNPDTSLSFGEHQGLAIEGGMIHPVWAGQFVAPGSNGNLGLTPLGGGFNKSRLTIVTAQATYAAGPRVLSGTSGPAQVVPVNGRPFSGSSTPADSKVPPAGILVTFDHAVFVSTFTTADVTVLDAFGQPVTLNTSTPIQALDPSAVTGGTAATTFFIRFAAPTAPFTYTIQTTMPSVAAPVIPDLTPFTTGIVVTFDRPVDVSTFTASQANVFFRDTVTPLSTAATPVPLDATTPVIPLDSAFDGTEATTFFVKFAAPQAKVGTYSYAIGPDIRDKMRSPGVVSFVPDGSLTFNAAAPQVPVTIAGDGSQTNSFLTIAGVPAGDRLVHVTVNTTIHFTNDGNLLFGLFSPTGQLVLLSIFEGTGANFINTTFDDSAGTPLSGSNSPFTGTFRPDQPLSAYNGGPGNGRWQFALLDGNPTAGDTGQLDSWSLTFTLDRPVIGPSSPGNLMDQNANGIAGEVGSVVPRVPGDYFASPSPINGVVQGDPNLFEAPYDTTTLPIIVPGPSIVSTFVPIAGVAKTADNLVPDLRTTGGVVSVSDNVVSAIDVTFDRDMDPTTFVGQVLQMMGPAGAITGPFTIVPEATIPGSTFLQPGEGPGHFRTFRIMFPPQTLSGTYTVSLAAGIQSAHGDKVDANQNAGVDLLFNINTPGDTTANITYNATSLPALIPSGRATNPIGRQVTSTITITDNYLIQDFILNLDITYPNDPDLEATLTTPGGQVIQLFTNVGNVGAVGTRRNFTHTILDDNATTPIQNGAAPFFGRFNPQQPFLPLLGGTVAVAGTYTLTIKNDSTSASTGTLNSWSITATKVATTNTGLGEPVADRESASFRIFTMAPTNPLASNTWTGVGPASNNGNANSSRIGGIAIDPSDPSGNTAYVAGASGGVWKTTDFLTTAPGGPTYIPLTDNTATFGMNIGSIAAYGRNNDPNQSIVVAATGEGDTSVAGLQGGGGTSVGVGFLISFNGGTTWTLLDSTHNYDSSGNELPESARDHIFVGSTSYKVLIDPHPTPSGNVIIYAALSGGANAGIWRSLDSGRDWQLMRAGQATDVAFDPNSGTIDALSNPTGNLRVLYGAFRGEGVFLTPNQGQTWNLMAGGVGDPLIRNVAPLMPAVVTVTAPPDTPNGSKGRIVLAHPALTGNALLDAQYETWLYAAVVTPDDQFNGLYLTKDNGQNWTKVRIPTAAFDLTDGFPVEVVPTNDITQPDYNLTRGQGNYDLALAIDPNNPSVVYVGGTFDFQPTTLIRVDTSRVADPHSLYLGTDRAGGGGSLESTTSPVTVKQPGPPLVTGFNPFNPTPDPLFEPFVNLIRNPNAPFLANSTVSVTDTASFSNDGSDAYWTPFTKFLGGTDIHRIVAIKDPVTGKTRVIVGLDQGIFTGVDAGDGSIITQVGTKSLATGSVNGNLQINQFYNGAAQPSALAAQIAGALFYGMAQDNGFPQSTDNIDATLPAVSGTLGTTPNPNYGNLGWSGGVGDGQDVATDQTGSGTSYFYKWPCCINDGSAVTDFFKVRPNGPASTETSRTFGLIQASGTGKVPDPQWPLTGGFNFAVNPVDGLQMILGSGAGRLFGTENQGDIWYVLADPTTFDSSVIPALAYGAPDPNGQGVPAELNNYILVGTSAGHIFVTFTGGGSSAALGTPDPNAWINLSAGLVDNAPIQRIVTDPNRGSHDAYAISSDNVYYNADTSAANSTWVQITGNIFGITHTPFGDPALTETQLKYLTGLVADWRYVIPNTPGNPTGPTHPMLYVAGEGGVYRSTDNGSSWSLFPAGATIVAPSNAAASVTTIPGGNLPDAHVTDLDLALGNVDPTTGRPNVATGPNILLATTYGRGSFSIRLAPVVFNDGTNNVSFSTNAQGQLVFSGLSEQTAFGNQVAITVVDVTDPAHPIFLGGYNPGDQTNPADANSFFNTANQTDAFGQFNVAGSYPAAPPDNPYIYEGNRTVAIFATDESGTKGNVVNFQYTNNPATPAAPVLLTAHLLSGGTDLITSTAPNFRVTIPNNNTIPVTASLIRIDGQGNKVTVATQLITGTGTIADPGPLPLGTYQYEVQYQVQAGVVLVTSPASPPTIVQVIRPLTAALSPSDDSSHGTNITNVRTPHILGLGVPNPQSDPNLFLSLLLSAAPGGSNYSINVPITGIVNTNTGQYSLQFPFGLVPDGVYTAYVRATDGIPGDVLTSTTATFTIKTVGPQAGPSLAILAADVVPSAAQPAGSGRTVVRRPRLFGQSDPGAIINIYQVVPGGGLVLQATTTALSSPANGHPAGYFQAQLANNLGDGTITLQAFATDNAGNSSPAGAPLRLTIFSVKGDYFGNGQADLGVYYTSLAGWYIRNTDGTTSNVQFGYANHDIPIPGDYFGNGLTDVAVFRPTTDTWYIDGTPVNSALPPATTKIQYGYVGHDVPVPAGYDAVGYDDVAVYRPSTSQWFILHNLVNASSPNSQQVVGFGPANGGFKPVPGDYEGVQSDQIALYDPASGNWYVRNSTTGLTDPVVNLGVKAGDIPVPADYDGIGRTEEAIYRPSTGQFLIYNPVTNAIRTVSVGPANTAIPVPEDYTGDGKTDAAVFVSGSPSSQWIYVDSTTGNTVTMSYGSSPSIALPGPLVYRINGATGGNAGIPAGSSAGGGSIDNLIVVGGGSGSASSTGGSSSSGSSSSSSSSSSGSGSNARAAIVVGGSPGPGSTATGKASNRPTSGTATATSTSAVGKGQKAKKAARGGFKLADVKAGPAKKAVHAKSSHDLALEHLGRAHKGRFFG